MVAKACQYLRAAFSPRSPAIAESTGCATTRNARHAARNIIITSLSSRFGGQPKQVKSEIRETERAFSIEQIGRYRACHCHGCGLLNRPAELRQFQIVWSSPRLQPGSGRTLRGSWTNRVRRGGSRPPLFSLSLHLLLGPPFWPNETDLQA